ncbi:hypothetical protein GCM10025331_70850 [Actinoplanes utahensis]|nr:hypothetical protein Aut01nite_74770 [Actinoplanes utahensis]
MGTHASVSTDGGYTDRFSVGVLLLRSRYRSDEKKAPGTALSRRGWKGGKVTPPVRRRPAAADG